MPATRTTCSIWSSGRGERHRRRAEVQQHVEGGAPRARLARIDERAAEVQHHEAAVRRDSAQHVVGQVARHVDERACGRVRRDHRRVRHLDRVPERLVGDVRDVDQHAESIHLANDLPAEVREPAMPPGVAGRVGPAVAVVPGERHVTDAEIVEVREVGEARLRSRGRPRAPSGRRPCRRPRLRGCPARSGQLRRPACRTN